MASERSRVRALGQYIKFANFCDIQKGIKDYLRPILNSKNIEIEYIVEVFTDSPTMSPHIYKYKAKDLVYEPEKVRDTLVELLQCKENFQNLRIYIPFHDKEEYKAFNIIPRLEEDDNKLLVFDGSKKF